MAAGFQCIDLSAWYNNVGLTRPDNTSAGAFNVWRNSLPAPELPCGQRVTVEGVPFLLPPADGDRYDNVRCAGQVAPVPRGAYDWVYLLTTAERRVEDEMALHFADGAVDFEPLRVSDFWVAPAVFGETAAFTTTVMHYPRHIQRNVPATVWSQRVPVTRRGRLRAVRFPDNLAVHILAMTLCEAERRSHGAD
ncbi:hypothetical protein AB0B12_29630 [Streptomyces sp. NPDC044780]|uniref:hypothetical protein n=1 Tax=unclassified Streptomyces TaxID=2593676 RepID=UPI0033D0C545